MLFSTPVVLLVFNRPEQTRRLFEVIRQLRPLRLIVIQDAPRESHPDDEHLCAEVREIVTSITWPCQAQGIFAEKNMGCALRIRSGLDEVFSMEEQAIILEDDCIPDPSFFPYCDELLGYYANDTRIMAISGDNFHNGAISQAHSYYFSRYFHCWGWATWRRAWQLHRGHMEQWPELRQQGWLQENLSSFAEVQHWTGAFNGVHAGLIDSWAFGFVYTIWRQNGLTILPRHNLVSNIGFCEKATHAAEANHPYADMATAPMEFPLSHPPHMVRDFIADQRFSQQNFLPCR
jgi:hypothetical protein